MKFSLISREFVLSNGKFDLLKALKQGGYFAGECYDQEGYDHIIRESAEKTQKRVMLTLDNGHHSVYDHIFVTLNFDSIPKIWAMVLNNEKVYVTSEKSSRYTPITPESGVSEREMILYEKWRDIFISLIQKRYGNIFDSKKIKKLAQENARYMVSVFVNTKMIYTVSLRQINILYSMIYDFLQKSPNIDQVFYEKMLPDALYFLKRCKELNLIDNNLAQNTKQRQLSLFIRGEMSGADYIGGSVYSIKYWGSIAQLAQAHRHRTINYSAWFKFNTGLFYCPPIIAEVGGCSLVSEWIGDLKSVENYFPQGQNIGIVEEGIIDNFLLKCKERLCFNAQLEIMQRTKKSLLLLYQQCPSVLKKQELQKYLIGARCTFGYKCSNNCGYPEEGVALSRII